MTIGALIQQYCDQHGITNQQFSESCGLSKGYISMLINGKNPKTGKPPVPTVKTYQRIAEAMGLSINELLTQTETDTPSYYHVIPARQSGQAADDRQQSYRGVADAIVEKLRESADLTVADDELWQMREDMRRNPELRVLYDLQRKATRQELRQMEAFIRAIRTGGDNDD